MTSSSDEDLSKFSEATDTKLFNNSLFSEDKGEQSANVPVKSSLRYLNAPDENRTDLKVTPGFQKHVASRLMKILDSSLDQDPVLVERTSIPEHDSNGNCMSGLSLKKPEGGIKLFGASAAFLASCNITPPTTKRPKRGRKTACISSASEDESCSEPDISNLPNKDTPEKQRKLRVQDEMDLSEQFAACAVSSEWILTGEAVKGWAPPHRNKEPIQGEVTPDLIKMASLLTKKSAKHKKKKKKHKKEKSSSTGAEEASNVEHSKKRGKRGSRKSKRETILELDEREEIRSSVERLKSKSLSKKKRREIAEAKCDELLRTEEMDENEFSRALYRDFKRSLRAEIELQGTSRYDADLKEFTKKKKKKKKHKSHKETELDESLHALLKKAKKKKGRKERENELSMPVLDDEGFDSGPTKADRHQRRLLKVRLKKQMKQEKRWQNNMECLSKGLANLMMKNVKED